MEQFSCLQASIVCLLLSLVRSHDVAICVCIFGELNVRTVGGAYGVFACVCVRLSETQVLLPCKIHTRVRASCDLCLHFGELARVRVLERSFARDVFVIWRLIFSPD